MLDAHRCEAARHGAEFEREGCREVTRCACVGGSNGSVGWKALPRTGGANIGLQGQLAADGADVGSRLTEEVLTRHVDDRRPAGSVVMKGLRSCVR